MVVTYSVPVREDQRSSRAGAYAVRVGTVLREARRLRGLRQEDVAVLVGATTATVMRYETGKTSISGFMLERFAETLDIPEGLLVRPPDDVKLVQYVLASPRLRDVPPELRALEAEFRRERAPEDDPEPRRAAR